ncbi:MAG: hypothetical protein AAF921_09195 [Cyanobacteria bacterium P01_D01_bin.44]
MQQLNSDIMGAVEAQGYRVTIGDVSTHTGLDLALAQQGLLALAADTQAHMQVAETGDIAYEFPKNFRAILRNKYWQLRFKAAWEQVWEVLFYLIRISFGVVLMVSIVIVIAAIVILQIAAQQSQGNNDRRDYGSSGPRIGFNPYLFFYWFDFDLRRHRGGRHRGNSRSRSQPRQRGELGFLEAIFSFLFGDGDPNADLEERRWGAIATVIRNYRGAVTAEQITPYLDDLGKGWSVEYEDYMLPVLARFNGQPKVSPEGDMVYHFPELQVTAADQKRVPVNDFLQEVRRRFTAATSDQVMLSIGLGSVNFIAAIFLGIQLQNPDTLAQVTNLGPQINSFIGLIQAIYWFLWSYGAAFLGIPLVRYFWLQRQNQAIVVRNGQRQQRALALAEGGELVQRKLQYAQQYASETVLDKSDAVYSTETDLLDQEHSQRDRLDAEWQRRLGQSNS